MKKKFEHRLKGAKNLYGNKGKDLFGMANSKEIEFVEEHYDKDLDIIINLIKSEIAQNLFNGRLYYYQVRIQGDSQVNEALKLFPKAHEVANLRTKG